MNKKLRACALLLQEENGQMREFNSRSLALMRVNFVRLLQRKLRTEMALRAFAEWQRCTHSPGEWVRDKIANSVLRESEIPKDAELPPGPRSSAPQPPASSQQDQVEADNFDDFRREYTEFVFSAPTSPEQTIRSYKPPKSPLANTPGPWDLSGYETPPGVEGLEFRVEGSRDSFALNSPDGRLLRLQGRIDLLSSKLRTRDSDPQLPEPKAGRVTGQLQPHLGSEGLGFTPQTLNPKPSSPQPLGPSGFRV
eukprot:CAMPEP_0184307162 /NCGR_PEP_ID=MMETSP1049-20130417/15981_1 /TAXON_ID=77928 /ORGANISM="Proteomonas sulcata, Strain CCMP704" /LENGTH=251 /DNA_ID=CAMNT_0026619581 /DNA_START=96 /DNA_END=852 /DNA_ORIENTATION=+